MDVFFPSFLPLTSQAPQLGDVVHLGSDPVHQQHDNGLISDHVLIYSKDCFSCRIGEQHCVAAEGEAEMCQIKGKKYRVIFLTGPPLNLLSVGWNVTDFKKTLESQTGPPLMIEKSLSA